MFVLVTYDIDHDRTRKRVATVLEAHGRRVQYSVFECHLTRTQLRGLKERLGAISEETKTAGLAQTFSIRYYSLCRSCIEKIEITGQGAVTDDPDYYIA